MSRGPAGGIRSRPRVAAAATVAALAIVVAFAGQAPPSAGAARCVPARSVHLLLDDSQSMFGLDPGRNRLEVARLLLGKAVNRGAPSYGALEFGAHAAPVFAPARPTRANVGRLLGALASKARGDGSRISYLGPAGEPLLDTGRETNLDRAFAAAALANPGAQARVLITDGGHNDGPYRNGHRRGPRTYVVGLGVGGASAARLRRIARETRGRYLPQPDSGLTAALDAAAARLACARSARALRSAHSRAERRRSVSIGLGRGTRSVEVTLLWREPSDRFELARVELLDANGSVRRPARLRQRRFRGRTFLTARLTGPGIAAAARLRVTLRASRLASSGRAVATVSLAQARTR